MGTKAERQVARALVAAYHEARLADLIEHVEEELDPYRAGQVDAYAFDETVHQYHRASQENLGSSAGRAVSGRTSKSSRGCSNNWPKTGRRWTGGSASPLGKAGSLPPGGAAGRPSQPSTDCDLAPPASGVPPAAPPAVPVAGGLAEREVVRSGRGPISDVAKPGPVACTACGKRAQGRLTPLVITCA